MAAESKKLIPEFLYYAPLFFFFYGVTLNIVTEKLLKSSIWIQLGVMVVSIIIYYLVYMKYKKLLENKAENNKVIQEKIKELK